MKYDIFISYRRKESSGRSNVPVARTFKLEFEKRNYKVFFDYSECTDNYFSENILPAIRTCDYFVLVLTTDCLSRCFNEGDWVRREIEEALKYNKKIIPITPDNECDAWPNLPNSLRKLDGLQITTIHTDQMFESCVSFLIKNRFHNDEVPPVKIPEPQPKSNKNLWIALGAVAVLALLLILWPRPTPVPDNSILPEQQTLQQPSQNTPVVSGNGTGNSTISSNNDNTGTYNGHEWVNLGLPSGTLWATCNIGATSPEDYGNYYAWGETYTKSTYDWDTYKYALGDYHKLTKYCGNPSYGNNGFTDNLTTLQPDDDPATVNWGSGWCTPTEEQWKELRNKTSHTLTTRNGVKGSLFTSKQNGQTFFLPAAGSRGRSGGIVDAGDDGRYWSSSLYTGFSPSAIYFGFNSGYHGTYEGRRRNHGLSVRAVREN